MYSLCLPALHCDYYETTTHRLYYYFAVQAATDSFEAACAMGPVTQSKCESVEASSHNHAVSDIPVDGPYLDVDLDASPLGIP